MPNPSMMVASDTTMRSPLWRAKHRRTPGWRVRSGPSDEGREYVSLPVRRPVQFPTDCTFTSSARHTIVTQTMVIFPREATVDFAGPAVAAVALAFGAYQYLERRRQQLLLDLQGGKEAAASAAAHVRSGDVPRRFPKSRSGRHRRELFEALCLAAVFESSGRSRSLIYDALGSVMKNKQYRTEIDSIVKRLSMIIGRNTAFTDLRKATRRIELLRAALGLDADVRIRIGRFDGEEGDPNAGQVIDWRMPNIDALQSNALQPVVERLGNVVIVAPRTLGNDLICSLCLDYHRHAWTADPVMRTPPQATDTGNLVISEKYEGRHPEDRAERDALRALATRLAIIVKCNPAYDHASAIAIVPGSTRDFSKRLGEQVAELTGKPGILLRWSPEIIDGYTTSEVGGIALEVPSPVSGRVIVLDDVYRTGRTLNAAARALREAGAQQVLGLTATCTISPAVDAQCDYDILQ